MAFLTELFREKMDKNKDYRMKTESDFNVLYPTGFLNFDFINGTVVHVKSQDRNFKYYSVGIPDGCMCMFIGRSGSGKTTFAVQAAKNIVEPYEGSAIFHEDLEGGSTEERRMLLTGWSGEKLKQKYLCRNTGITAENFYERVKVIHDIKMENRSDYEYDTGTFDPNGNRLYKMKPTVMLLDSVALLMPDKYTEEEELSGSMSSTAAAKTNSMVFKRIVPMLKAANIILFLINHVNMKIDINPMAKTKAQVSYLKQGESLPGGNTIIYLANLLVRFDDGTKLTSDKEFGINGSLIDLGIVKSRTNRAGQIATLVFDQNRGFDPILSLFIMLKNTGAVKASGAYFSIGEYKFTQKTLLSKIETDPGFKDAFIKEAIVVLKQILESSEEEVEIRKHDFSVSQSIMGILNEVAA